MVLDDLRRRFSDSWLFATANRIGKTRRLLQQIDRQQSGERKRESVVFAMKRCFQMPSYMNCRIRSFYRCSPDVVFDASRHDDLLRSSLLIQRTSDEREHQRPAASVLPKEDRLPRHLSPRPCIRDRATQQSTTKETQLSNSTGNSQQSRLCTSDVNSRKDSRSRGDSA